jgi:hypothetical protein
MSKPPVLVAFRNMAGSTKDGICSEWMGRPPVVASERPMRSTASAGRPADAVYVRVTLHANAVALSSVSVQSSVASGPPPPGSARDRFDSVTVLAVDVSAHAAPHVGTIAPLPLPAWPAGTTSEDPPWTSPSRTPNGRLLVIAPAP